MPTFGNRVDFSVIKNSGIEISVTKINYDKSNETLSYIWFLEQIQISIFSTDTH